MRFAFLAATLVLGAATASAQSQKPTPPTKPALQLKTPQGKPTKQGLTPSNLPGRRNAGSTNLNILIGGSDDCNTPDAISGTGTFAFDQTAATTGAEGQNEYICYDFGSSVVDNDVWFAWTAPSNDTFQVQSCNLTSTDTKIAAYAGAACPTMGTALACNDDTCGLQSSIMFPGSAGSTYMLQIGTFPGATGGTGSFGITAFTPAANDDCSNPTAISGTGTFTFNNSAATTGAEGQNEFICYDFGTSAVETDVWFAWTAPSNDMFRVQTCGGFVDTKIAAYPGSTCPTSGSSLACNDDNCGYQSMITFSGTAGSTYMIQIGTFPNALGGQDNFDISVFTPAANDDCSNPTMISGTGTFPFDNTTSTTGAEGQNESLCYDFGTSAVNNDVWFEWTSPTTDTYSLETCNFTSLDTKISVHAGAGCPVIGSSIGCNDDACGLQSAVWFSATAGSTYTLQIGSFSPSGFGTGDINIYPIILAPNDSCATPDAISGAGTFTFNNTLSTTGAEGQNESICYDFGTSAVENDVWFVWTSNFTGSGRVTTCTGQSIDTRIAIYPGSSCPTPGTALDCNDDMTGGCASCASNGFASEVYFSATSGSQYMIQVGTFPNATGGLGTFTVDQFTAPPGHPHDECSNAEVIAGSGSFYVDTAGTSFGTCSATDGGYAQNEALCYAFGTSNVHNDVWFEWTSNGTGLATVSACGGMSWDTKIAAYPGGTCPPTVGSILACNDDTCGLQSEIIFSATNGSTYLIQFGAFSTSGSGDGNFTIDVACNPCEPGIAFCRGDGTGSTFCPCGNPSINGGGCANGSGNGGTLGAIGDASISGDTLVLQSTGLLPNQPCLFFQGNNAINGGNGIHFGDGLRCAGGGVIRLQVRFPGSGGNAETNLSISVKGGCSAGDVKRYQNWYRDPNSSVCGALFNLTNGYEIIWQA